MAAHKKGPGYTGEHQPVTRMQSVLGTRLQMLLAERVQRSTAPVHTYLALMRRSWPLEVGVHCAPAAPHALLIMAQPSSAVTGGGNAKCISIPLDVDLSQGRKAEWA